LAQARQHPDFGLWKAAQARPEELAEYDRFALTPEGLVKLEE
jgi:hypothetical protein